MLTKIKIDFCTDQVCAICESHRELKEAVFLKDENDQTVTISKHCYDKLNELKVANYNAIVPDLTKGANNFKGSLVGKKKVKDRQNIVENDLNKKNRLLEYLILRQEKLVDFGTAYSKLDELYRCFTQDGSLKDDQYVYLDNLIKYTQNNKLEYSLSNLQKLYASSFWLKYAIERTENLERKKFLSSILNYYYKNRFITFKQNVHVIETFERINQNIKSNKIPRVEFILKTGEIDEKHIK